MTWVDAARHVVDTQGFVMVRDDGTWSEPTESDWRSLEVHEAEDRTTVASPADGSLLLDLFTARMLVQVYDALNADHQAKLDAMTLPIAVEVCWRLVGKAS